MEITFRRNSRVGTIQLRVCVSYAGQIQGPEHLHSRIRRVYYVVQSFADFGTAARSPFRTAFLGGQHTSTVFADRPSRNVSPVRRRVRGLIDPSSSTHVVKGKRTLQCCQKAVWFT
jgi:hypothetical protein